jgi:hypothetical protein
MNLEYGNWDSPQSYSSNDGGNFSTDYGAQSPMISHGPGAGFKKQQLGKPQSNTRSSFGGGGGDIYDFEIGQDIDYDDSPVVAKSKRGGGRVRNSSDNTRANRYSYDEDRGGKPNRRSSETYASGATSSVNRRNSISDTRTSMYERKSKEDRVQEILEKNKIEAPVISKFDNEPKEGDDMLNSYQKLWADVMEGVGGVTSPEVIKQQTSPQLPKSEPPPPSSQVGRSVPLKTRNSMDSFNSLSDSFDISPADFEVGVTAARRKQEKTNERMRRFVFLK